MKTVQEYLDEVCGTISCIPYRRTIRRELKSHMEDSITKKKAQGMDPKEAVRQTISELGMPESWASVTNRICPCGRIIAFLHLRFSPSCCI